MNNYFFETDRMYIRTYKKTDDKQVWKVLRHPKTYETTAYITKDYPLPQVKYWIALINSAIRNYTSFEFGMFDKNDDSYIGNIGIINYQPRKCCASVTYFVDPNKWNNGYATEGLKRIMQFAIDELGVTQFNGSCMAHNIGSRKVMEKCGLKFIETNEGELYKDGKRIDVTHLSMNIKNM